MTMNKLENKVALVTGGTSGIGLGTAQALAEAGATVFITGRRQVELDAAVALIGERAIGVRSDVSNLADLDALYATIKQRAGRLDILFANAGGGEFRPLAAITEDHYHRTFDRNVKGVLFTVQKALALLVDGASIILCASTTSVKGTASLSVYSASKAAVRNFARSWLLDLKDRGIRVNAISPGPIYTPGLVGLAPTEQARIAMLEALSNKVPMGRLGTPRDIGAAVVFLASSDSSFINGVELFVDGGVAQI